MIKFEKALPGLGNSYEGPDDEFVSDKEHGDAEGQDDADDEEENDQGGAGG